MRCRGNDVRYDDAGVVLVYCKVRRGFLYATWSSLCQIYNHNQESALIIVCLLRKMMKQNMLVTGKPYNRKALGCPITALLTKMIVQKRRSAKIWLGLWLASALFSAGGLAEPNVLA